MNKGFAKYLIILGFAIVTSGIPHNEICAQNSVSRQVVPNSSVHFGNLQTENKNLFVKATRPPDYKFDVENVKSSDSRN